MTCIVGGVTEDGHVILGSDSASSNRHTIHHALNPKLFKLHPAGSAEPVSLILGFTSSWRMGQVLQHQLAPPSFYGDPWTWVVSNLVPKIRRVLKDGGFATIKDNQEIGGTFLLGVKGRLFTVQDDFSVIEEEGGFDGVGSGGDHAQAAMYAARHATELTTEETLKIGLETAAYYVTTVAGPMHFISTEEEDS